MARGIDERPVITEREEKSMGGEHTFETDTTDAHEVSAAIRELSLKLGKRLRFAGKLAGGLSLKFATAPSNAHPRYPTKPCPNLGLRHARSLPWWWKPCEQMKSW